MASISALESPSSWPCRRARRLAAASKLQHVDESVRLLEKRIAVLEISSKTVASVNQPECERSPELARYSREELLSTYQATCISTSTVPDLPTCNCIHHARFSSDIIDDMDKLSAELKEKLYGGSVDIAMTSDSWSQASGTRSDNEYNQLLDMDIYNGSTIAEHTSDNALYIASEGSDGLDAQGRLCEYLKELAFLRERIPTLVKHIDEASIIAARVEGRIGIKNMTVCISEFLDTYDSMMDPNEIAREAEFRKELEDLEVCKLGTLFVFAPEEFTRHTRFLPTEFRESCDHIRRACEDSLPATPWPFSLRAFEETYFTFPDLAFTWQSKLPDGELMALHTLFHSFVKKMHL